MRHKEWLKGFRILTMALALAFGAILGGIGVASTSAAEPAVHAGASGAKTIFVGVHLLGRRKGAAKKLNQLHAEQAAEGWRYANMQAWVENGDLEGFFVTYTR